MQEYNLQDCKEILWNSSMKSFKRVQGFFVKESKIFLKENKKYFVPYKCAYKADFANFVSSIACKYATMLWIHTYIQCDDGVSY